MKSLIYYLLAMILLVSCKTQNLLVTSIEPVAAPVVAAAFVYDSVYEYRIRKDDKISISVWGEEEYSVGSVYGIYNSNEVYGKWLLGVALLQWGSSNFFVLVSGIYLGIEALGALRLVQSFFGVINVALQTVENHFLPKIAALYLEYKTYAKNYLFQLFWKGGIVLGSVMLVLFQFADSLIVFAGGTQYASYGFLVKAIAVLYLFIFAAYPFRIAIRVFVVKPLVFCRLSDLFCAFSLHISLALSHDRTVWRSAWSHPESVGDVAVLEKSVNL